MIELVICSLPASAYLLWRRRDAAGARAVLGWVRPTGGDLLWGLLLAFVGIGLAWLVAAGIPAEVLAGPGTTGAITGLVPAFQVACRAVGEEILFRGLLQGLLEKRWGSAVALVAQGVVFLLPHLLLLAVDTRLWVLLPVQFLSGLLLGVLRARHGSIGGPALAHVVTNLVSGLARAA